MVSGEGELAKTWGWWERADVRVRDVPSFVVGHFAFFAFFFDFFEGEDWVESSSLRSQQRTLVLFGLLV